MSGSYDMARVLRPLAISCSDNNPSFIIQRNLFMLAGRIVYIKYPGEASGFLCGGYRMAESEHSYTGKL